MTDEENKDQNEEKSKDEEKPPEKKETLAPIPYERFKEVNDKATKLEADLNKILGEQKKADDKKLADDNRWKELAESKDKELTTARLELLRLRIAAKKSLPVDLVDRLKGETEEEIEADADKLLEFVKPDESKGIPPHKKGGKNTELDIASMTPEEIRKNTAAILKQGL